jgi:hypothetical protein
MLLSPTLTAINFKENQFIEVKNQGMFFFTHFVLHECVALKLPSV